MSDQFCLKWNNHHTTLVTVFDKLFECESLVDCTLAAEGKYMKAHKVVLSACSSYLEEILKNTDDKHPILIFNDISYDELKAMLEYMYRGEVNVSQDQLSTFIKAAEALKIKGLTTDQGGGQASSQELRRKVGLKDSRSHSPVVGMTPVERPTSPKRKRRRSRDDNFAADSNSCDTASTPPPTQNSSNMTPKNEEKTSKMKKESSSEPATTPTKLLQPKIEFMDDSRNMEEYSLEEDEDYGPNPGTSQGSFFGGQDFNNWTGSESQHDDVSIGSQNELNNTAGNSQGMKYSGYLPLASWDLWASMQPTFLKSALNTSGGFTGGDGVECTKCGRHYKLKSSLRNHQKWECGKEPQFQCPYCNYRAKQKMHVARHIERMHREKLDLLEMSERQAIKEEKEFVP